MFAGRVLFRQDGGQVIEIMSVLSLLNSLSSSQ